MNLILFSESFPYSIAQENTFIFPEINALCNSFDKVIIVPLNNIGSQVDLGKYSNIIVDESFANSNRKKIIFVKDIFDIVITIVFVRALIIDWIWVDPAKLIYNIKQIIGSNRIKRWLKTFLNKVSNNKQFILYTYWFDYATIGCSYFSHNKKIHKIITRAHGYDVYDFRVPYRSSFIRNQVLSSISAVYTVSKAGASYLQCKYPKYSDKIFYSYLGINKTVMNCLAQAGDGEYNFFSCSFLIPLKRVMLLASYIIIFAKMYPKKNIVWVHAGDGELFEQINDYINNTRLHNLKISLMGAVDNAKIIEHYITNPVDIFLSLSETEGIPISMLEAQSFGVPIIATNVGGVAEIVIDGETGFLLTENPTENEFVEKVDKLLSDESTFLSMRKNSYKNWKQNFDANKNHYEFVSKITM
jgi:glycosyltransferase involved in cell wall biosynthesis